VPATAVTNRSQLSADAPTGTGGNTERTTSCLVVRWRATRGAVGPCIPPRGPSTS
jgi:hypothetical protein